MDLEDFTETLRTGPVSEEIIQIQEVSEDKSVKFKIGEGLVVSVDLHSIPPTISGFQDGEEVIREPITEQFGSKWRELALEAEEDFRDLDF